MYRRQDDPAQMHLNDTTFDAAIGALHRGEAVQIYPEGLSHSGPALTPIRSGAARIALMSESQSDWQLGVCIQPVGLTYTRKHLFRGRVVAAFGEPFRVADLRSAYEEDDRAAVRMLTDTIREKLEALTLNFDHPQDRELVEVAERLYAREKRLVQWRERDAMASRLPRLKRFADGIRWLRATDPEQLARLSHSVRRYLRLLKLLGATEGDVPPNYRLTVVLRYSVRQLFMLALVVPAALLGMAIWVLPYMAVSHVTPRFRPELDQIATYKMATSLLTFPSWWGLMALSSWFIWGVGAAAAVVGVTPVAGLAAIAWRERQGQVREDVRVFLRAVRHPSGRDRLAELRRELTEEFDRLGAAWVIDSQ